MTSAGSSTENQEEGGNQNFTFPAQFVGIALAGKALCIGSLCSIALAGGAVFGTCKLLGISKLDDLTKLKKGEFSLNRKKKFGSGRRIDTWQQLLDYINEPDRTKDMVLFNVGLVVPLFFAFIYIWPLYLWLSYVKHQRVKLSRLVQDFTNKTILLVTAHPDDECMFFAPTLLNLRRMSCHIIVVCLTSGGYRHSREVRKLELHNSCRLLGVPKEDVLVLDDNRFPDNPMISWDQDCVTSLLEKIMISRNVDVVFTFDQFGVSGHLNHCSIHRSFRQLLQQHRMPKDARLYVLDTVSLVRKYSGIFDFVLVLPQCGLSDKLCFINSPIDALRSCHAMSMHGSQLAWFRLLYLLYSRYMFINQFTRLK
ncbi:N-acetylglucosaminyl-phosphatidylinositol de-N-acetylase domain protein [Trichuris suis]|nr:N-acetylglucosaminyl-phosphatidylinositol de-N-acetylase domain protein [Trichuris suis]